MAKYLDPKADLTFKKVFGEHKELLISFLNAMLPLPQGKEIVEIEYKSPELIPVNPDKKDTIVDVRCTDNDKRNFIVEMQMYWTNAFNEHTEVVDADMLADKNISKAIDLVQESAYTEDELYAIDRYWDAVSRERTLMFEKFALGRAKGLEIGLEIGRKEGIEIGEAKGIEIGEARGIEIGEAKGREEERQKAYEDKLAIAHSLKATQTFTVQKIAEMIGLSEKEVEDA